MIDWSKYAPFITEAEMRCTCGCGVAEMDEAFLDWLHTVRLQYDFPMVFTSAFRCANHPEEIGRTFVGSHRLGLAVDIAIGGPMADRLMWLAYRHDAYGRGARQHGSRGRRFIHLDRDPRRLEEGSGLARFWTYDAVPIQANGKDV